MIYRILIILSIFHVQEGLGQTFTDRSDTHLPEIVRMNKNSMDAAVDDIDGDGDPDIIIAVEFLKNIILINDGSGRFSDGSERIPDLQDLSNGAKPYPYYPYHDSEDVALADFDKDGDTDIVFVTEDDQINEYYLNDGKGYFTDATDQFPAAGVSNAVIAHDFDNDGYVDIMIGNNGQNVYLRNNNGTFVDETVKRMPAMNDITQDLEAYDIDNDNDLDVVVGNELSNYILHNDGKGFFTDATDTYILPEYQISGETREADFGDVNNDGLVDLFFANVFMFQQLNPVQRLLINTGTSFKDETKQRLGFTDLYSVIDVDFTDLDRDGHLDIILVTFEGPRIMKNNGKGFFSDITESAIGKVYGMGVDAEVADYNNDGKPDIYLANFRSSDILLIQN